MEQNYDFLQRFRDIHQADRRTIFRPAEQNEIEITSQWSLEQDAGSSVVEHAVMDFQNYMQRSMGISLSISSSGSCSRPVIRFVRSAILKKRGAFEIHVEKNLVEIIGDDERGILRGGIYLEDLMNLVEGPYLRLGCFRREPELRMRLIHSGSGIDDFPDWQLNAILHAGYTAIDLFVRDIDLNGRREYCNINDLIDRAESYGLDTILYNYMKCFKHPDDSDADQCFDAIYGNLFRHYPKAAGITLVGESLEFPSHDERTTGKKFTDSVSDGIPETKPSPGWFPCRDYPALLQKIVNSVHKVKPDAEIVFSTYNWSYLSVKERTEFLEKCPRELTINIAYDMQQIRHVNGLRFPVMDYTAAVASPGEYFLTESSAAHKNGLKIRVCSNTGGCTWDFGAVPYVPVFQLWLKRIYNLRPFVLQYGADSFYEGHHYGWWPNIINDLMKRVYMYPEYGPDDDRQFLEQLAIRDYGVEKVAAVWQLWSDALIHTVTSNEDQYGPLRVGPAYPFIFQVNITRTMLPKEIPFPCSPHAMMGNNIIKTLYQPYENVSQSPAFLRYPVDLKELATMLRIWLQGCELLKELLPEMPAGHKWQNGMQLHALGHYMANSIRTVVHIKQWYLATKRLQAATTAEQADGLLEQLLEIAGREEKNVTDTIPWVECDSRLGWEPSMDYVCDRWHLEWKLRQLKSARIEIEQFRKTLF